MTSQQYRYAIFYVINNKEIPSSILIVKRPPDDPNLPNVWGLPAGNVPPNMSFEDGMYLNFGNSFFSINDCRDQQTWC